MRVLALIPAYNEEATVASIILGVRRLVPDVLVVDDGSQDGTNAAACAAGALVQRLDLNMGKGEALKAGFAYAIENGYDGVLTLDGDGQHDTKDIAAFLSLLDRYDLILGNRMEDSKRIPLLRLAANRTASFMVSVACRQRIRDSQSGFRFYSAPLLKNVGLRCSRYDLETEVIIKSARQGFRIGDCRVRTIYAGEVSRFSNIWDSVRFLKVVILSLLGR